MLTIGPQHQVERVVIIGAGGFIGGAIATLAEASGHETVRITREDVDLLAEDASDVLAAHLRDNDVVVAAAAKAPVKNVEMLADNLRMVANLFTAIQQSSISYLLNISSDAVYTDLPTPLDEKAPRAPTSLHGVFHLARELSFENLHVPVGVLRPTLVFGPNDPHNGYGPNRFLRLAQTGNPIVLFGAGEEQRDHVFVEDVARLALRMVETQSTGSLNAATGEVHSFQEVAKMVVSVSKRDVPIKQTERIGPMPHNGYRPFDPYATFAAFPDFKYTTLESGLTKTIGAQ